MLPGILCRRLEGGELPFEGVWAWIRYRFSDVMDDDIVTLWRLFPVSTVACYRCRELPAPWEKGRSERCETRTPP